MCVRAFGGAIRGVGLDRARMNGALEREEVCGDRVRVLAYIALYQIRIKRTSNARARG